VPARSAERLEFLGDVITTALEGGIGYWSQCSQYQYLYDGELKACVGDLVGAEPRAVVHELRDDGEGYKRTELVITPNVIARGIDRILAGGAGVASSTEDAIRYAEREHDAGEIDASHADAIVQVALFGKLVYG
jgi:hypothetical protein